MSYHSTSCSPELKMAVMILLLALLGTVNGAVLTSSNSCRSSTDCHTVGQCCRDGTGNLVGGDNHGHIFGGGPFLPGGSSSTGICSDKKGKEGDTCDSHCACDAGFECYRPMSGVCCPPHRCYNATWVAKQKAYWSNCGSDPTCFFPPR